MKKSRVKSDINHRRILFRDFAQNENCDNSKTHDERKPKQHGVNLYPTGSLVRVANYSPYRGMKGRSAESILFLIEFEEPFCFYLVDLEGHRWGTNVV